MVVEQVEKYFLLPASGFFIGYYAYKSFDRQGFLGLLALGTIGALGLAFARSSILPNLFQAENVDNALITGSVEGEPAMFLFKKGDKDDTGFTTGRIMVDDDLDEIYDTIADIHEDVGEDRIKTGFKSWKRNVWGLKPYAAEHHGNHIFHTGCGVCGESCSNCGRDLFCWDAGDEDNEGGNLCCPCSPRPCPTGTEHGPGTFRNRDAVIQEGEVFETATDDWILSMKRLNPLSRHFIPKKNVAAEEYSAEYCSTCQIEGHDSCPLEDDCPCCDNTMMGIYRQKDWAIYEAESYKEFFEEIEKLMNETAGSDWDLYAETKDGTVSITIDYTPLDPEFFDDYGEIFEESDEKESEHMSPKPCSICGQIFTGYGNNPEPVVPISTGQCCDTCNAVIVIPARMRGMGFRAESTVQQRAKSRGLLSRLEKSKKKPTQKATGEGVRKNFWKGLFSFNKEDEYNAEVTIRASYDCDVCGDTEEFFLGERESLLDMDDYPMQITTEDGRLDVCWTCYDDFNREEWEASVTSWSFAGDCCAQQMPQRMPISDDMIKICATCEEEIDGKPAYCTSCMRRDGTIYFFHPNTGGTEDGCMRQHITLEKAGDFEAIENTPAMGTLPELDAESYEAECSFHAEQTLKGKVRTMSGKPHKTRKLVKDKDITAEEAATRLKLESPVDAYGLAYNQGFDDARTAKRWSPSGTKKMTYAPDDSYKEDEQLFEDTYKRR